jgi:hypothetical protein
VLVCNTFFQKPVEVPDDWSGIVWVRTGCNFDPTGQGQCETGDCGNKLHCNGTGPVLPVTKVLITLNTTGGNDTYIVSVADGFNVPIEVRECLG